LDNVDPHIREVVKAACEGLPLAAKANGEHAIAIFGKRKPLPSPAVLSNICRTIRRTELQESAL
jgi:hypothetical protein